MNSDPVRLEEKVICKKPEARKLIAAETGFSPTGMHNLVCQGSTRDQRHNDCPALQRLVDNPNNSSWGKPALR